MSKKDPLKAARVKANLDIIVDKVFAHAIVKYGKAVNTAQQVKELKKEETRDSI